jgi:hypothetical protein
MTEDGTRQAQRLQKKGGWTCRDDVLMIHNWNSVVKIFEIGPSEGDDL